ncbi:hypothetical protein GMDG_00659 [Pseudogymnoascus destructans 20631-21]|uniref:Uncharacterized protein n=1 Tax=Pseudogymnoascus destructans (strain ATCC MYA-4855 / 20631-21) TaxID=658429 RepID=L8G8R3_PSED2|nr:hypothetical protein GMDG_00659 [Pseudogymnoascus destructans 20631-21]
MAILLHGQTNTRQTASSQQSPAQREQPSPARDTSASPPILHINLHHQPPPTNTKMATPTDPLSRRTLTTTESAHFRRPRLASLPESPPPRPHSPARSPSPLSDHPPAPRRRSSLISLISIDSLSSLSSARRTLHSDSASLLHPPPVDAHDGLSAWHSLPLAFALLPALGGLMFKDGSRFVSDVLLLGLAAVFLNWSVRLPWDWYRSAQEIRTTTSPSPPPTKSDTPRSPQHAREIATYTSATNELRTHELLALLSCVILPLLSAGLLHILRNYLRAGASGLVSDFNLVAFMLAAEIRPVGQLLRLVRARTLWLQRVVKVDPRTGVDERQDGEIEMLRRRVEVLEQQQQQQQGSAAGGEGEEEVIARVREEVRKATRQEVEALSRAVRRYEKRAAVLAGRVEGRLGEVEGRLGEVGRRVREEGGEGGEGGEGREARGGRGGWGRGGG